MASKHRGLVRKRTCWLFVLFFVLYGGTVCALVSAQLFPDARCEAWASEVRFRKFDIPASRGCIYDRAGRLLAFNVGTASIFANRNEVRDSAQTAAKIAPIIGQDPQAVESRLANQDTIIWLARQVSPEVGDQVRQLRGKVPGIGVERHCKRVYPAGSVASQVLGFTNFYNDGVEGLECILDDTLSGKDGLYVAELDAQRRAIPETRHTMREPEDGLDVYLTIDVGIQHIAEQALAGMAEKFRPESACAIVMDPHTGEILALANYPSYDPNQPLAAGKSVWRNRAVADSYEPGSTLKVVTVAAAVNEGVGPRQIVADCTGLQQIKGGRIRCPVHHPFYNGHGPVDCYAIIRHSCNIGAAQLAFRLGPDKLYKYEKAFGLLSKPNAGFGCEAAGFTTSPDEWSRMRLANVGFGQGIAVTPLQMAGVYAAIANGGCYVEPHIIRELRNGQGPVNSADTGVVRRAISEQAARDVTRMLQSCVTEGTGKNAQIDGRTVAGKTGSAQIPRKDGRGYEPSSYVSSFIGFAPATKPSIVIAVVVKRPKGSHYGAVVAAPVFQEIGEKTLWYLKVPSDVAPSDDLRQVHKGRKKGMA